LKKARRNKTWLIATFSLFSVALSAQQVRISSSVDSTNYAIGDWIRVRISADHKPGTFVLWDNPLKLDSNVFSKISESGIDTIQQKDFITENRTITITSFDTGLLRIPAFTLYFQQNGRMDSLSTSPLMLYISSPVVDTSKSFRPIKSLVKVETVKSFTWLYVTTIVSLLILIAFTYWFSLRKKRKKLSEQVKPWVDPRLPHEVALDELAEMKNFIQGNEIEMIKYYTRITQIVRQYIESRFKIPALENTTYELVTALKPRVGEELLNDLRRDFFLADFVKFAKAVPSPDENHRIMNTAKNFIEKTAETGTLQTQKAASAI
jgi:hypothetical protein